jgi:hypothetical protein
MAKGVDPHALCRSFGPLRPGSLIFDNPNAANGSRQALARAFQVYAPKCSALDPEFIRRRWMAGRLVFPAQSRSAPGSSPPAAGAEVQ